MPLIKFIGILQQKYGEKISVDYEGKLCSVLDDILDKDELNNKYLRILLNGKFLIDLNVEIKQDDIVTVYIFGGSGYPGG